MMADGDVDMEKLPTADKVPVVHVNETSAKCDKMFSLKRWNAVAMWSWGNLFTYLILNLYYFNIYFVAYIPQLQMLNVRFAPFAEFKLWVRTSQLLFIFSCH